MDCFTIAGKKLSEFCTRYKANYNVLHLLWKINIQFCMVIVEYKKIFDVVYIKAIMKALVRTRNRRGIQRACT